MSRHNDTWLLEVTYLLLINQFPFGPIGTTLPIFWLFCQINLFAIVSEELSVDAEMKLPVSDRFVVLAPNPRKAAETPTNDTF